MKNMKYILKAMIWNFCRLLITALISLIITIKIQIRRVNINDNFARKLTNKINNNINRVSSHSITYLLILGKYIYLCWVIKGKIELQRQREHGSPLMLCSFLEVIGHCQGHCTDHSRPRPWCGIIDHKLQGILPRIFHPTPTNHLLPASVVRPMSQRVTMATEHPSPRDDGYRCVYTIFILSPSVHSRRFPRRIAAWPPSISRDNLINAGLIASVFNFNVCAGNSVHPSVRIILCPTVGIVNAYRNCFRLSTSIKRWIFRFEKNVTIVLWQYRNLNDWTYWK